MKVAVDIVIFTIQAGVLKVLLVKRRIPPFKDQLAISGGFVLPDEDLEKAALRELREETGVTDVYLEQLYSFGDPKRDPRGRIISISYFALISPMIRSWPVQTHRRPIGGRWRRSLRSHSTTRRFLVTLLNGFATSSNTQRSAFNCSPPSSHLENCRQSTRPFSTKSWISETSGARWQSWEIAEGAQGISK